MNKFNPAELACAKYDSTYHIYDYEKRQKVKKDLERVKTMYDLKIYRCLHLHDTHQEMVKDLGIKYNNPYYRIDKCLLRDQHIYINRKILEMKKIRVKNALSYKFCPDIVDMIYKYINIRNIS